MSTMDLRRDGWRRVQAELHRQLAPHFIDGQLAHALTWCEDYLQRELSYDPDFDAPGTAARAAIAAGKRANWR